MKKIPTWILIGIAVILAIFHQLAFIIYDICLFLYWVYTALKNKSYKYVRESEKDKSKAA